MKDFKVRTKKYFLDYDWKLFVKLITFIGLLFLLELDQLTKFWARTNLTQDVERSFIPGFINLKYVINYGSAFGLNQNKTAVLVTIAFLIAFVLLIWWIFSRSTTNIIAVTFILAGTIGNLSDRFVFDGGVIDFLKWDMFEPKTIFNVADIMVTIGIIIIVVRLIVDGVMFLIEEKKEKKVQHKTHEKQRKAV
ncbi:signal peptidase II [Spiroplasma platyhelix]|uniref:Lipoprotein signal peptidase n=1 Tax=Spiroplasma platyhelix PALS-1 TaxID=1276218 RepID=A0A846TZE4_9MOLU|nr:signal peptidase II [Spiroplasma platyhelix]MBE4703781.1 Lipoprotein signal peptidase [Spiroplasma platyhelix PALS-1]NKE38154.1 signal peptidase II [Spiroplasma platyhelix PALS-1]UJB29039.1 lipoprotein signal peptidase [Spiroplasma platyhelix PALS-1]